MTLNIKWWGHSCFQVASSDYPIIVTDPFDSSIPYSLNGITADVVTSSHNHYDHNNIDAVAGSPRVLNGLTAGGDWLKVKERIGDVAITSVPCYHDSQEGAQRGKNSAFRFQFSDLSLIHLGDLGHILKVEHIQELQPVDILLIPVGGFFTITASEAWQVIGQLQPRLIIPMHYKTPAMDQWPISDIKDFSRYAGRLKEIGTNAVEISTALLPSVQEVWVLKR